MLTATFLWFCILIIKFYLEQSIDDDVFIAIEDLEKLCLGEILLISCLNHKALFRIIN